MVRLAAVWQISSLAAASLAWAESEGQPLLTRLSPQNRAIVLMALLGLVLVGMALVALAILGGRHVMREARRSHGPTPRYEDAWYRKPLFDRKSDSPGDGPS